MADDRGLLELACELATLGGTMAADGWRQDVAVGTSRRTMAAATKSSLTDVVTRHDRAAEASIVATLAQRRPDDAIVGEEGTQRAGNSGLSWYLDPIDGTTNFLYGFPLWSTSVGVADPDGSVAGAVFVPATGELFAAARGRGATRNGEPIRASTESDPALALVATGFAYLPSRRADQGRRMASLLPQVRDVRRGGSAAIDLCYAAAGIVDAYFEDGLNSWDVAAGELIAREAGCRTGDFSGGPARPEQLLAAPPGLFERLAALLVDAEQRLAPPQRGYPDTVSRSHDGDVDRADRLEHEAQRLIDDGRGDNALKLALDQLHADRANGEPLDEAIDQLRRAIEETGGNRR
jgi:myo-inositol-1(or 4)-monophosphatase